MSDHGDPSRSVIISEYGPSSFSSLAKMFDEGIHLQDESGRQLVPSERVLLPAMEIYGGFPESIQLRVGASRNGRFSARYGMSDFTIVDGVVHRIDEVALLEMLRALGGEGKVSRRLTTDDYYFITRTVSGMWDVKISLTPIQSESSGEDATPAELFKRRGLTADLFGYQVAGALRLSSLVSNGSGALLADQMGLGKTLQAIALLVLQEVNLPSLVVCPGSLLVNWYRELENFAPRLKVLVHAGPSRYGVAYPLKSHDVVVTSFDLVVQDASLLTEIPWNVLVVDEAQQIRNPDTRRAQQLKSLPRRSAVAITGTPIENTLGDMWSISELLAPQLLGGRSEFERQFPDEQSAARALGEIVTPIVIRRSVTEVAGDLPPKLESAVVFDLPNHLLHPYLHVSQSRSPFEANVSLRAICAHASEWDKGADVFSEGPKVSYLTEKLNEIASSEGGEKVLVFAPFHETLDRLHSHLRSALGIGFFGVVDGRSEPMVRQGIIDAFNAAAGFGVLLLNPRAAGVGLNITGANHVFHFSPEYNPQVTSQATARAYRRKQERTVFVRHLAYAKTVEERATQIADTKMELSTYFGYGVSGEPPE